MYVHCVSRHSAYALCGVLIGAHEITYINKRSVIRSVYGINKLLDYYAVLHYSAVIFYKKLYSVFVCIIGNNAYALGNALYGGSYSSEAALSEIASYCIASCHRCSERFCGVDKSFSVFNLLLHILCHKIDAAVAAVCFQSAFGTLVREILHGIDT